MKRVTKDGAAIGCGLIVLMFSVFVGVPSYMRGKAYAAAGELDGRVVKVSGVRWSLAGDIEIQTEEGHAIFFSGKTPFASYVVSGIWMDDIRVPVGTELRLTRVEDPQVATWWRSNGGADEWTTGTWLSVEIVDHF